MLLPYSSSGVPITPRDPASRDGLPKKKPFYKRPAPVIAAALGLVIVAGAAFAVYYLFFRTPPPNVALQAQEPDQVLVGEPFDLTISYSNASEQALQGATVAITVPEGVSVLGVDPSVRVSQQDAGDIGPQGMGSRTFRLIATDGAESVKRVTAVFRYHLNDNRASRFEASIGADIAVGAPAVAMNFDVPQNVFAAQDFAIGLSYQNHSKTAFGNAKLFFDYPQGFQFVAAEGVQPAEGANEWHLDSLGPEGQGEIKVTGRVTGNQQAFFTLGVHLQVDIEGRTYALGAQTATVGVSSAPLGLTVVVNNKPNYAASLGEQLTYTLSYRNGSQFALQNVVITAALEGQLFNLQTVASPATLDSVRNTLTWNTANTPALATVTPGAGGKVDFRVTLAKSWPITKPADKDFTLAVHGTIQSLTVPSGVTADQTRGLTDLLTKVRGERSIETTVYYKDPDPAVLSAGPYPPKVNQKTEYTVHWRIRNWATDLDGIHVSAVLQSGAKMTGVVKSTAASVPSYDPQTGRVTWDIPSIAANQGALGAPVEAVFRIEAIPAVNQAGSDMPLIGETLLSAQDGFTGTAVLAKGLAKNSGLPDDSQAPVSGGDRRVQP